MSAMNKKRTMINAPKLSNNAMKPKILVSHTSSGLVYTFNYLSIIHLTPKPKLFQFLSVKPLKKWPQEASEDIIWVNHALHQTLVKRVNIKPNMLELLLFLIQLFLKCCTHLLQYALVTGTMTGVVSNAAKAIGATNTYL